ncbi:RNA polymerase sigma factor [Paracoccus spongiarum]|uniref:Sigma-70 family RNA polymerase sigma factor n=1 Tax=Paracoccus spongiarum TaxID=3064387 RepID=A0ABT9J7Z7_9RHOB|nr:sigma-70 family RNA polymerase sigma factor [Paracoccus sp. 2205BS29-5]MDP5305932.1 sigma-70 family RNA polymerase sigma factor [Paracoccus sp. 2205BS29-5]
MDAAFGEDLIRLLPNLRRYALSLTRRPDLAEDLVQITVERAIAASGSFQPGAQLAPWLLRIARNAFIDMTRRQKSEGSRVDIHEFPDAVATDGEAAIEARLMLQATRRAMQDLPEDQREILHLVCIQDLSYAEAAEVLDIPRGTVMSRLSRARLALAQALGLK